jgi:beta-phosphoglucomutase-like phosphatase (HAD superfamily)
MDNIINNYDLFIFDLDDTIVKTEHIHYKSWLLAIENTLGYKYNIEHNTFYSIFHSNNQNSIKDYLKNIHNLEIEDIIKKKDNIYFALINEYKNDIKMIDGCEDFINQIIENKKQFIIVSNTLKEKILFFSELFPILKKSSKNYSRELFKIKKPNPECYFKVLDDFPNMRKVGFEDSITGIHAITQIPEITTYYINKSDYVHHEYILKNYKVNHINDYKELN